MQELRSPRDPRNLGPRRHCPGCRNDAAIRAGDLAARLALVDGTDVVTGLVASVERLEAELARVTAERDRLADALREDDSKPLDPAYRLADFVGPEVTERDIDRRATALTGPVVPMVTRRDLDPPSPPSGSGYATLPRGRPSSWTGRSRRDCAPSPIACARASREYTYAPAA